MLPTLYQSTSTEVVAVFTRSQSANQISIMLSSVLIFGQISALPHRHGEKERCLLSFFAQSQVLYLTDPSVLLWYELLQKGMRGFAKAYQYLQAIFMKCAEPVYGFSYV